MKLSRRATLGLAAAALVTSFGTAAFAGGSTINVSLWDTGPDAMDMLGQQPPRIYNGPFFDPSKATMGIQTNVRSVPAGKVTFNVVNDSKDTVHEMIVAPVPENGTLMPYEASENRVLEEDTTHYGEVSELDPGAKGSLTLTLKPGDYLLYCNIPGHYELGMWSTITVK